MTDAFVKLLDQGELWNETGGRLVLVAEMSVPHKLNCLALMERRAVESSEDYIEFHGLVIDHIQYPVAWIRGTALYREMMRQVSEGFGPPDPIAEFMARARQDMLEHYEACAEAATWD